MLYFYSGTQYDQARKQARSIIDAGLIKNPQSPIVRFDSFTFSEWAFDEALGAQGLFGGRPIIEIKEILEEKSLKDSVLERLPTMADDEVCIVWTERKIDEKTLATISKYSKEAKIFGNKKQEAFRDSTSFDFAELCVLKDKKKAWIFFEQKIRGQIIPEEIVGTLIWQYKMIALSHKHQNASEAGVSPYAFSKAKRMGQKCSLPEALKTIKDLIAVYHRAHRGELDLAVAIEKFILDR